MQFAYKPQRGTSDATLTLIDRITQHLDSSPNSYARILFIDFTSAFNTMQPHLLIQRLIDLSVNGGFIRWICDFLTNRPQKVFMFNTWSQELVLNTGAPQGCVLSPLLFSVYTDEMQISIQNAIVSLYKYADDMALVALLRRENNLNDQIYFDQVLSLEHWCDSSHLLMNAGKTKELIVDLHKEPILTHQPVKVAGENVEVVESFKYLGTHIDKKLTFQENTDLLVKKASQRLYLLRKLCSFHVSEKVLETTYKSLIESIITFNITAWYGNLTVRNKTKLGRVVQTASKIIGRPQTSLNDLYNRFLLRKAILIVNDEIHPLNEHFNLLPSGRRYRVPRCRVNIYKNSFTPSAIAILNS